MEKMSYQDAKKIRAKSFGDIMANKLSEGQGIGSSLSATLSEKSAARMKGFKEKFDPMNIAKFVTGGSNLAPALVGRLTGRSSKDIKYFSGIRDKTNDTATKLEGENGGFAANNQMIESLLQIYDLLKNTEENKKKDKEKESQFAEENKLEKERNKDRRHKELMEAITGKPYETATKVTEEEDDPTIFDKLFDKLYGKMVNKVLEKFAKWFLLSNILTGVALPVAALMAPWLLTIYQRSKIEEDPNNPEWKDTPYAKFIRGEAKTQGAAAAQNQRNVIKQVTPQYAKDLLAASPKFTDAELVEETGKNRKELEEWIATNPKSNLKFENKQVPAVMEKESGNEQFKKEAAEFTQRNTPPAIETPTVGQKLESVQAENLNSKIQEKTAVGQTVVNNAVTKSAMESMIIDGPLLPVRNMEESYQDMIFYSTRIV